MATCISYLVAIRFKLRDILCVYTTAGVFFFLDWVLPSIHATLGNLDFQNLCLDTRLSCMLAGLLRSCFQTPLHNFSFDDSRMGRLKRYVQHVWFPSKRRCCWLVVGISVSQFLLRAWMLLRSGLGWRRRYLMSHNPWLIGRLPDSTDAKYDPIHIPRYIAKALGRDHSGWNPGSCRKDSVYHLGFGDGGPHCHQPRPCS